MAIAFVYSFVFKHQYGIKWSSTKYCMHCTWESQYFFTLAKMYTLNTSRLTITHYDTGQTPHTQTDIHSERHVRHFSEVQVPYVYKGCSTVMRWWCMGNVCWKMKKKNKKKTDVHPPVNISVTRPNMNVQDKI